MSMWSDGALNQIGTVVEMRIAALRPDGAPRKSVIIWVVRVGNDLYVRSYRGANALWFRGTRERPEGVIKVDGVTTDVTFVDEADPATNALIDAAFRTKYADHGPQYLPEISHQIERLLV